MISFTRSLVGVLSCVFVSHVTAQTNPSAAAEYDARRRAYETFQAMRKHFDAGVAYDRDTNYNAAIVEYEKAAQIDPNRAVVFGRLCLAQFYQGALLLNEAIRAKDTDLRAKAISYFAESVASGERATQLDSTNTTYKANLVRSLATLGQRFGDAQASGKAVRLYEELAATTSDDKLKKDLEALIKKLSAPTNAPPVSAAPAVPTMPPAP
jgi:tetratricopeptide (TPR) repeat protein